MVNDEHIELIGSDAIHFSYGQMLAYDADEAQPGSIWTERHFKQGFVRREHAIGIGMLSEFGTARLRVFRGPPISLNDYARVISVPITLTSGVLRLNGPEEYPTKRSIRLKPGTFRLSFAQEQNGEDEIFIDLYVERTQGREAQSSVLKVDQDMQIPEELLESGDAA